MQDICVQRVQWSKDENRSQKIIKEGRKSREEDGFVHSLKVFDTLRAELKHTKVVYRNVPAMQEDLKY